MFITFEGPEGAGKTTAMRSVAERLRAAGRSVTVTREPGAGSLGAKIREILLHGEELNPKSELFLFLADRANHVSTVIRPALAKGSIVLCDRFADSTVVYQSHARGLARDFVLIANAFATGGLLPDLTLLFDVEPLIGLPRIKSKDRLDGEPIEFHEVIRRGFLAEAKSDSARWKIVDGSRNEAEVFEQTWAFVDAAVQSCGTDT